LLVRKVGGVLEVRNRPGRMLTPYFPDLAGLVEELPDRTMLDGELVCFGQDGGPDLHRVRSRLARSRSVAEAAASMPATLVVFDVLAVDGRSLVRERYEVRRRRLDDRAFVGSVGDQRRCRTATPKLPRCWTSRRRGGSRGSSRSASTRSTSLVRRSACWRKLKHR
jgi:bifunctional non-homologous end joining protein LigD